MSMETFIKNKICRSKRLHFIEDYIFFSRFSHEAYCLFKLARFVWRLKQ